MSNTNPQNPDSTNVPDPRKGHAKPDHNAKNPQPKQTQPAHPEGYADDNAGAEKAADKLRKKR